MPGAILGNTLDTGGGAARGLPEGFPELDEVEVLGCMSCQID